MRLFNSAFDQAFFRFHLGAELRLHGFDIRVDAGDVGFADRLRNGFSFRSRNGFPELPRLQQGAMFLEQFGCFLADVLGFDAALGQFGLMAIIHHTPRHFSPPLSMIASCRESPQSEWKKSKQVDTFLICYYFNTLCAFVKLFSYKNGTISKWFSSAKFGADIWQYVAVFGAFPAYCGACQFGVIAIRRPRGGLLATRRADGR